MQREAKRKMVEDDDNMEEVVGFLGRERGH